MDTLLARLAKEHMTSFSMAGNVLCRYTLGCHLTMIRWQPMVGQLHLCLQNIVCNTPHLHVTRVFSLVLPSSCCQSTLTSAEQW